MINVPDGRKALLLLEETLVQDSRQMRSLTLRTCACSSTVGIVVLFALTRVACKDSLQMFRTQCAVIAE